MAVAISDNALDRSIVRAVAWSATAKWATQIVSLISTLVVARLLTPSDYGLVGMAGIYLALASLVSQAGISDAIVALRDLTSRQIAELNTVAMLMGVGLFGLSCAVAHPLARFFSAPPLRAVLIIASTTYLINGMQVVPRALLQKELRFKLLAGIETVRALLQIITTLVLAWLGFGYWSLVNATLAGTALAAGLTLCWRRHQFAIPNLPQLRRELQFSGNMIVSSIGSYAYSNADFLVAGRLLGQAPLGDYTVAWTISSSPIEKIGNLVTNVTPAFFSAIQKDKAELRRYVLRLTETLAYVTVPASMGIALTADYVVPVLLGPKWTGVIGPLRLLGILMAFRSITTLLPKLLTAIGETSFVMWTTILSAIILPVAFLVGSRWGTNGIAAAWIVAYPPIMAPLYYRMFQRIEMKAREYVSSIMPALSATMVMCCVLLLARWMFASTSRLPLRLAVLVLLGALAYLGALFCFFGERLRGLLRTISSMRDSRHDLIGKANTDPGQEGQNIPISAAGRLPS